jgi:hypothetical protein
MIIMIIDVAVFVVIGGSGDSALQMITNRIFVFFFFFIDQEFPIAFLMLDV